MWYRFAKMFPGGNEKVKSEEDKGDYILREIETDFGLGPKDKPITITSAFSKIDDGYIGEEDQAKRLAKKGIAPQKSPQGGDVCCIGFNEKEQKWYGWSHRAMKGFGIGDKAEAWSPYMSTKSDERIKTLDEAKEAAIDFADSVS